MYHLGVLHNYPKPNAPPFDVNSEIFLIYTQEISMTDDSSQTVFLG